MDKQKKDKLLVLVAETKKVWQQINNVLDDEVIYEDIDNSLSIPDDCDHIITKNLCDNNYIYTIHIKNISDIDVYKLVTLIDDNKLLFSRTMPYIFDITADIDDDADIYKAIAFKKDNCIKIIIPRKISNENKNTE